MKKEKNNEWFSKFKLLKLVDISTIIISFLLILYGYRINVMISVLSLLILYSAMRNLIKEFVYPY